MCKISRVKYHFPPVTDDKVKSEIYRDVEELLEVGEVDLLKRIRY